MTDEEVMILLNKEKQKYADDLKDNIINEAITDGLFYGSALSTAALTSFLTDNIPFNVSALVTVTIATYLSIRNHKKYARTNDTKENIKILKKIKFELLNGENAFENVSQNDFSKYLKKIYNYH